MTKCKLASTPLLPEIMLTNNNSFSLLEKTKEMENIPYHKALGSLIWLQVTTHPDLFFLINLLLCFAHNLDKAY